MSLSSKVSLVENNDEHSIFMSRPKNTLSTRITTLDTLKAIHPSKVFKNGIIDTPLTSLSYDDEGRYILTSGTDETLQLYEVPRGHHVKSIFSKKYGCDQAIFTHNSHTKCIFASTKENHILRLLNLNDNSFIRYFKGHDAQVVNLINSTSSTRSESFYSSSIDGTVKCWDLRVKGFTASLGLHSIPLIALDPSNTVMAILEIQNYQINLVSMEKFPSGLIASKNIKDVLKKYSLTPVCIQFTNDNRYILVTTAELKHLVLDAYTLDLVVYLSGGIPFTERQYPDIGCLTVTPNSNYALSGSGNGNILIWNLKNLQNGASSKTLAPSATINNKYSLSKGILPRMIKCNPRYEMLAAADTELSFWTST